MAQSKQDKSGVPAPKSIHAGHRQRTKDRFLKYGGEQLEEHQILELILFYSHPYGDVNPLAHQLIDRFGSLKDVLEAPLEELVRIPGVTEHTVALLRLFPEVAGRYRRAALDLGTPIQTPEQAAEILQGYFMGARYELFYLLSLDAKDRLLGCDRISEGSVDQVLVNHRRILQVAIQRRASSVILAHCHITGLATPSPEDIAVTAELSKILSSIGIRLQDHLVFADGDYISMVQSRDHDPNRN